MVSILFELLTSKKTAPPLIRVENFFVKIEGKGYQKKRNLRWFQKCVESLCQEVPKDFFSEKQFFAKFSKSLKIQFFCEQIFPFDQTPDFCTFLKSVRNSASYDTLYGQLWRNFFPTLIRGEAKIKKPFSISENASL